LRALKAHFIGIGGTGMGAFAALLKQAGHEVRGSDVDLYPPMSTQLDALGIPTMQGHGASNLDWGPDCVVVGNVCSREHPEVVAAQARGLPIESFPSLLGKTLLLDRRSLVVAGTHGKTTTASLVAWLLRVAGEDPSFLIGGVPTNFGRGSHLGRGPAFVIEGDEYDTAFFDKGSKFLHYRPFRAVLTSVEFDHADMFSGMEAVRAAFLAFVRAIPDEGDLVVHSDDTEAMRVAALAHCHVFTYRVLPEQDDHSHDADFMCAVKPGSSSAYHTIFEVFEHGESLGEFQTMLVGRHNLANVLAAIALCRREGVDVERLRAGVRRFRGVKRRQEFLGVAHGVRVIEDFAHHPTAVQLTVTAMRRRYPDHALHVCFEPRSASSRRNVFFDAYASSFDAASYVYIGALYRPDKIAPADRLDPTALAKAIQGRGVDARAFPDVDGLASAVVEQVSPGDTVVVLSCGAFGRLPERVLFGLGDPVMPATPADRIAVDELLVRYGLPPVAAADEVDTLVIPEPRADEQRDIIACVSLHISGEAAFLFGLAVTPERRGEGLGWVLADSVLGHARALGARVVYLTTSTAADFFAGKLGFRQVAADAIAPNVRDSRNFAASAGLPNAVCMVLELPHGNGR